MHVSRPSYYSIPSASRPSRLTLARAKLWLPAIILISILLSHHLLPVRHFLTWIQHLQHPFLPPHVEIYDCHLNVNCKEDDNEHWKSVQQKWICMSLLAFDRIDRVAIRESRLNETHDVKRMYAVGGWSKECTVVQCPQPWNFMKKGFNISLYFGIWIIPSKVIGILFDIWKLRKIVRSNA
jgi:hypothetical protein